MNKVNKKTKIIALGGFVTLFSVVSLYLASIVPTNRLFFLALSSFFISLIVIEHGLKHALVVYLASSLLSFIIIPSKLIVLPYIVFFGYYAVIKSLIERTNNLLIEWIIKLLTYNIAMYVIYLLTSKMFFDSITVKLPIWAVFVAIQVIFILYDYCFSLAIQYYNTKLKNKIKIM